MSFAPASVGAFRFVAYGFDEASATARLDYAFDDSHRFREELVFHGAELPLDAPRRAALDRCLAHLHLAAGVSYYKAAVPPEIRVETGALPAATARFFEWVYFEGLGEFAYRNELELKSRIRFPADGAEPAAAAEIPLPRRTAAPLGGGKDSAVALEGLRAAGEPLLAVSLGEFAPIRAIAERAGVPQVTIARRIAPELLELNARGAYNGHVPFSAILAFVLAAAAVLYGFDAAALGNERSASAPDLVWRGRPINHEWSKGFAFEHAAGALLGEAVLAGFDYFSLLRPYSELGVTALFSRLAELHPLVRSCNAAYRLAPEARRRGWCRDCPKCRFVFLALAAFLPRARVVELVGGDLLADPSQVAGYTELAGLGERRPFECVGEPEESRAALALLAGRPEWAGAAVVEELARRLPGDAGRAGALLAPALAPSGGHRVPARLAPVLARWDETLGEIGRELGVEIGRALGGESGAGLGVDPGRGGAGG